MFDMQQEIARDLNYYMPMQRFCIVALNDNEWRVTPNIDEDVPRFEYVPSDYIDDAVLTVNDHGNVDCYEWNDQKREYMHQWSMV